MSIGDKQKQLLLQFQNMDDLTRFDKLLAIAMTLQAPDLELRKEENRFTACQSNLWIKIAPSELGTEIRIDSDSMIVRAFTSLLLSLISGETDAEILSCKIDFWNDACFDELLSRRTRQGLNALIPYIQKMYDYHKL